MKIKRILSNSKVIVSLFFILMILVGVIYGVIYVNTIAKKTNELEPISQKNLTTSFLRDETYDEFVDKYNYFSAKISEELLKTNNVISPLSIFSNLALLSNISNNNTQAEISTALNMSLDELNKNYRYFSNNHSLAAMISCPMIKIMEESNDNSIWIQKGLNVNTTTTQNLANYYRCSSYYIDFTNAKANDTIRKYVKDSTNELIDIDFNISKETLLALISTNYLEAVWDYNELSKRKSDFKNADGKSVVVQFNESTYFPGRVIVDGFLKYFYAKTLSGYKVSFIVPKYGYEIRELLNKDVFYKVNKTEYQLEQDNKHYYTRCVFPDFTLESDLIDLKDVLQNKFGINDVFNSSKCDVSNLLSEPAYLSSLKHKAKLEVNEKGIKGASITMGLVDGAVAPEIEEVYEEFFIKTSFAIVISNSNNEIIFTGVVDALKGI